ncbi:MAG: zinc ribbon domain-containing protein [Chloroflexi bacterium]|nr:zinc ribbon domain-containing protein [Chloroflexota bacterium]MCI0772953.1 zinc ribbon domain-containing protein [Chloroflexota bacterium]MCI0806030.1 zinc ribbon domain-containing protein [Chloroflexota bacterium]MCI0827455.1 zinc ribbon domain-containing protein [Chloroflexota bacterium]MCI0853553.1 zinc ribbon domain-containing protein [Chloroflexota bacterium]
MDIGTLLLSLAMVVFVLAYVLRPLAGSAPSGDNGSAQRLSALQAERDRVLDSIQEIDMDHVMGKVPEEDYHRLRQALAREGAEILRKIDESQNQDSGPEAQRAEEVLATREIELEAAIAQLRGKGPNAASREKLEVSGPKTELCPDCGQVIFHADRYCAECGASLEEQVA